MKLSIIRHLQTNCNKLGILQGCSDTSILPPSEQDLLEIEQNKNRLIHQENPFDIVLASSLKRTQQTAACYGFNHVDVEPLLDELNFGEFEGRSKGELIASVGESWYDDPREIVLGEAISDLAIRIQLFLEKYINNKQMLIFSHGSWMRALISHLQDGNLQKMNQTNIKNNQLVELYL